MSRSAMQDLERLIPAFQHASVVERWAGAIALSPDDMPTVGAVPDLPGLILVSGYGYGLTWSPALAEIAGRIALGQTPDFDISAFDPSRFNNGSKIELRT